MTTTHPHATMTLHGSTVPVFARMFDSMLNWFDRAEAHAAARKFDSANYLALRLAPDMLPLVRQVQIATDGAKGCVARLTGQEPPKWDDDEASVEAVRARLRKAREYVAGFGPAQIDGNEAREIVLPMRTGEPLRFSGSDYVRHFVLPNFYFHATTTYALLRHAGVELGKRDFLGG